MDRQARITRDRFLSNPGNRPLLSYLLSFVIAVFLSFGFLEPAYTQSNPNTKAIEASFYPEAGCPVEVTSIRSLLEIDPFGAPIASRVYITYKNNSAKAISAVKFRIRYSDVTGKDKGTFHAPDGLAMGIAPGGSRSHKWRKEGGLHPGISSFKVRVFKVRYVDGSEWESVRARQLREKQEGAGQGTGSGIVPNMTGDQFSDSE